MSPRQLQRRFTAEIGIPPGSYVERVRVEAARRERFQSPQWEQQNDNVRPAHL
jgi:transcriptional regulator GlxA family with amidase domain